MKKTFLWVAFAGMFLMAVSCGGKHKHADKDGNKEEQVEQGSADDQDMEKLEKTCEELEKTDNQHTDAKPQK